MVYKWYILPIGGLYATYHLLGEPKTTIDGIGNVFSTISVDMRHITPQSIIGTLQGFDYAKEENLKSSNSTLTQLFQTMN